MYNAWGELIFNFFLNTWGKVMADPLSCSNPTEIGESVLEKERSGVHCKVGRLSVCMCAQIDVMIVDLQ